MYNIYSTKYDLKRRIGAPIFVIMWAGSLFLSFYISFVLVFDFLVWCGLAGSAAAWICLPVYLILVPILSIGLYELSLAIIHEVFYGNWTKSTPVSKHILKEPEATSSFVMYKQYTAVPGVTPILLEQKYAEMDSSMQLTSGVQTCSTHLTA